MKNCSFVLRASASSMRSRFSFCGLHQGISVINMIPGLESRRMIARLSGAGGKSGLRRARWFVTRTGGDPRESATENRPPHLEVRVKR